MTNRALGAAATMTTALALWLPQAAQAHTPYLLPNMFDAERDHITLQGALTEDDYFSPDIALKTTNYVETTPSGDHKGLAPAIVLKDVAVLEAALPDPGTYRFSTGQFVARRQEMALVNGRWLLVRPSGAGHDQMAEHAASADVVQAPAQHDHDTDQAGAHEHKGENGPPAIAAADVPAGAQIIEVQNVQIAETYVSKGAPTDTATRPASQGLELQPATHPNSIYVDQGFSFRLLMDGKPLAAAPISVYRSGDTYDEHKVTAELKSDADGMATIRFDRPGIYLLTTHAASSPRTADGPPPARSYVYSLTFEVTR
jgi:hypothetical protein